MKIIASACALFLLSVFPVLAQDTPAGSVFFGYSYLNIDTNGLSSRQSANGWEAAVDGNLNRYLAAEFDANGAYKNVLGANLSDYSYMGGVRVSLRPAFVHVLVGGDDLRGSGYGVSASQQSFAAAFGGGIEPRINRWLSLRASADYVATHHSLASLLGFPGSSLTQNNFRVAFGVVFNFGGRESSRQDSPRAARSRERSSQRPIGQEDRSAEQEAVLFGIAGVPVSAGVKVTLVRYQSAADRAGVQMDDVVTKIDGVPVHTIKDVETAVGKNVTGSIRVEYLTKGIAAVESTVAVAPPAR